MKLPYLKRGVSREVWGLALHIVVSLRTKLLSSGTPGNEGRYEAPSSKSSACWRGKVLVLPIESASNNSDKECKQFPEVLNYRERSTLLGDSDRDCFVFDHDRCPVIHSRSRSSNLSLNFLSESRGSSDIIHLFWSAKWTLISVLPLEYDAFLGYHKVAVFYFWVLSYRMYLSWEILNNRGLTA